LLHSPSPDVGAVQRRLRFVCAAVAIVATGCASDGPKFTDAVAPTGSTVPEIAGVKTYSGLARTHTTDSVHYEQNPPVGGPHAPVWQNCGYYASPIVPERGVHSMEHGAVWITYRPSLPESQVGSLRALVGNPYVLVSPWPLPLSSPVVLSAWGVQLHVDRATDPRVATFVGTYARGPQTPEPGAPCSGGTSQTATV